MQVGVVGLGEVGLKFAALAAESGMQVLGVDTAPARRRIATHGLRAAGYEFDIPGLLVGEAPEPSDVHVICVDSPIDSATKKTRLDNLLLAARTVGAVLRPGDLVIMRSTVPVGTTRAGVIPVLQEASGLSGGDFLIAFAPERTSTGGTLTESRTIRHLVGGLESRSTQRAVDVMTQAGMPCQAAESIEAAELGKLATNAVRDINQALANQLCQIAEMHGIDIRRLVDDVNLDYPRDRLKHASPGVGGSCLTKDSYILAESLLPVPPQDTLFGRARIVNDQAQEPTISSLARHFSRHAAAEVRILVCGAAFKGSPPTTDMRNSVGLHVARELVNLGFDVSVYDPVVPASDITGIGYRHSSLPGDDAWNAVLLYSNHASLSSARLSQQIVDSISHDGFIYDPHLWLTDLVVRDAAPGTRYRTLSTERVID